MAVFARELKANLKTLLIWGISVGVLILLMMMLFPSMKDAMSEAVQSGVYDGLPEGVKSAMFGGLQLNTAMGFYGVEAGFMLTLGGGLFGGLLGANMLAKEEAQHTAEFLFTTPVGRVKATVQKLLAMIVLVFAFDIICTLFGLAAFAFVGGAFTKGVWMYQLAQFIMHLTVAFICFGISAFLHRNAMGVGLAVALVLYFLSFFSGVNDNLKFLNYVTPYVYAEAGSIIPKAAIDGGMIAACSAIAIVFLVIGFTVYKRKDLAA